MRGLFEFPEVFGKAGDGSRRIEHDLGTVEAEQPRAFGEVAVVANIRADARKLRLERLVARVARLEVVLLLQKPQPAGPAATCGM